MQFVTHIQGHGHVESHQMTDDSSVVILDHRFALHLDLALRARLTASMPAGEKFMPSNATNRFENRDSTGGSGPGDLKL